MIASMRASIYNEIMQKVLENQFETVPHAADMRIRVWGKTLRELFRNCLKAMASYLKPEALMGADKERRVRTPIKVEAVDLNSLLVEFLSETLAETDIHNIIFTNVLFKKFGENFLEGELLGARAEGLDKDIKAVSYHEVDVKRNHATGMYETILVFDI